MILTIIMSMTLTMMLFRAGRLPLDELRGGGQSGGELRAGPESAGREAPGECLHVCRHPGGVDDLGPGLFQAGSAAGDALHQPGRGGGQTRPGGDGGGDGGDLLGPPRQVCEDSLGGPGQGEDHRVLRQSSQADKD